MKYGKFPLMTDHVFFNSAHPKGQLLKFATDLEKIGLEWDVEIRNFSCVNIISDPIDINTPKYGDMTVVKVQGDVATDYHTIIKEFWVPTVCIFKLSENNETSSTQLSN